MPDISLLVQESFILGITKLGFLKGVGRVIATVNTGLTSFDLYDLGDNFIKKITVVGND